MKQRITYLVKYPDTFTPEKLDVKDGSLTLGAIEAVKEHRLTFSLDELPSELRNTLKQWNELHIKWASLKPYTSVPPFTSRVTPGLHVFFDGHRSMPKDVLCSLLRSAFGDDLECLSTEETSIPLFYGSEERRPDASSQYFSYLPDLNQFVSYVKENICLPSSKICREGAQLLLEASYLDIDHDSNASNLLVTAFWDSPAGGWTEKIPAPSGSQTTEVGVLTHEPNPDPYDIAFGGFLTVLGWDTAPKPTRFQTPTLHYPLSSKELSYITTFQSPTGLHPTLTLTFPSAHLTPPDETCTLHTHLTLPRYLFIDRYQFSDPLFLSSHNLRSLQHLSGATDLEAPSWVVSAWGSSSLFALAVPSSSSPSASSSDKNDDRSWNVSIPLHLRYLPAAPGGQTSVPVPWPVVFWACSAEQDGRGNPFDRRSLGYEQAFHGNTRFMHVPPGEEGNGTGHLVSWIDVPVLDTQATGWVETGTISVVIIAFLSLCWVLFSGCTNGKVVEEGKKE